MIREMDGMREKITKGDRMDSIIKMEPQDFLIMKNQQQTMTSPALKSYIDKQKKRGFANIKEFEIEYYQRIAMSFAAFILTTIGVSLSSRKVKGGMGLNLGVGLALSFSYILFQTVSATFAINGNTPPIVAVWIPNILYTLIAIYLYEKLLNNYRSFSSFSRQSSPLAGCNVTKPNSLPMEIFEAPSSTKTVSEGFNAASFIIYSKMPRSGFTHFTS